MDRFNNMTPCTKCGAVGATTEYHDGKGAFTERGFQFPTGKPYLWRTCARCGYGWQEAPLDAVDPPPFKGNHIESKDENAVCICGENVVLWIAAGSVLPAVYRCPKAIPNRKAG